MTKLMDKNIVYVVRIWWARDDQTVDSVFIDKDKAMQRAKEILNVKRPYSVWISTAQLDKPDGVDLFYTEKYLS